jgi:arylsulfatase
MRSIRLAETCLCVLVLAGLACGDPGSGKQEGKETSLAGSRPNMVLIIADDVSATDIGCYGNADVRTPNLDRLASQGQMWSRAYLTATVCSPTRCSIITGRYPHNTGAPELHTALPEGQPMLPRELRKAGYWTAQAGKWHLGKSDHGSVDRTDG